MTARAIKIAGWVWVIWAICQCPAHAGDTFGRVVVTEKMRNYAHVTWAMALLGPLWTWAMLWIVLRTGWSVRLREWAKRRAQGRFWQFALYYLCLSVVLTVLEFPRTWAGGFAVSHAFGLSGQSGWAWCGDILKGMIVDFAIGLPIAWLVLWLVRRSPKCWSLWLWACLVPIIAFGIFLAPVVIDPVFNTFRPLPEGPLRTKIAALAVRAGIPNAPIYVCDASQRTRTVNAYVTGLGASARIVIWDTTLKELDTGEVVGIVAHEMGHYALRHVQRGFWETVAGLLILLPIGQWFITRLVNKQGAKWGLTGVGDMASVPVYLLALSVLGFASAPVSNALSRQIEHEADAYGLAACGDGVSMARAFVYFASHDLGDPYPPKVIKVWLYSHPPLGERIDFVLGRK